MPTYMIFRRMPGQYPRLHHVATEQARSCPDALRRYGLTDVPSNRNQYVPMQREGDPYARLYMAEREDRITFDYRARDGSTVMANGEAGCEACGQARADDPDFCPVCRLLDMAQNRA